MKLRYAKAELLIAIDYTRRKYHVASHQKDQSEIHTHAHTTIMVFCMPIYVDCWYFLACSCSSSLSLYLWKVIHKCTTQKRCIKFIYRQKVHILEYMTTYLLSHLLLSCCAMCSASRLHLAQTERFDLFSLPTAHITTAIQNPKMEAIMNQAHFGAQAVNDIFAATAFLSTCNMYICNSQLRIKIYMSKHFNHWLKRKRCHKHRRDDKQWSIRSSFLTRKRNLEFWCYWRLTISKIERKTLL